MSKTPQEEIEELKKLLANYEPLKAESDRFQTECEKISDMIWECKAQTRRKASWLEGAIVDARSKLLALVMTTPKDEGGGS